MFSLSFNNCLAFSYMQDYHIFRQAMHVFAKKEDIVKSKIKRSVAIFYAQRPLAFHHESRRIRVETNE